MSRHLLMLLPLLLVVVASQTSPEDPGSFESAVQLLGLQRIPNVKADVLNKITSFLPGKKIDIKSLANFPKFKLADPIFNQPNKVDLLLGSEVYAQILLDGFYRGPPGCPVAHKCGSVTTTFV
ncbi:unnamed protein product [Leptidea sinapis]|uniref:Uncharacterized protein n=1 Tax=Leptidea sinapis TaxID=189913 RepID=A0A5E4R5K9_9NEOP|nr:unnamed protein product [Leptidea sinapis]